MSVTVASLIDQLKNSVSNFLIQTKSKTIFEAAGNLFKLKNGVIVQIQTNSKHTTIIRCLHESENNSVEIITRQNTIKLSSEQMAIIADSASALNNEIQNLPGAIRQLNLSTESVDNLDSSVFSVAPLGTNGNGGNINVTTKNNGTLQINGNLDASGVGNGNGGSISLNSSGATTIGSSSSPVNLSANGSGTGSGGNIVVTGSKVDIFNNIFASGGQADGNGGNIIITSTNDSIGLTDSSAIIANGHGSGNGGTIQLSYNKAAQITLPGVISANATDSGNSGDVTITQLAAADLDVTIPGAISATSISGTNASVKWIVKNIATASIKISVDAAGQLSGLQKADAKEIILNDNRNTSSLLLGKLTANAGDISIATKATNSVIKIDESASLTASGRISLTSSTIDFGKGSSLKASNRIFLQNSGALTIKLPDTGTVTLDAPNVNTLSIGGNTEIKHSGTSTVILQANTSSLRFTTTPGDFRMQTGIKINGPENLYIAAGQGNLEMNADISATTFINVAIFDDNAPQPRFSLNFGGSIHSTGNAPGAGVHVGGGNALVSLLPNSSINSNGKIELDGAKLSIYGSVNSRSSIVLSNNNLKFMSGANLKAFSKIEVGNILTTSNPLPSFLHQDPATPNLIGTNIFLGGNITGTGISTLSVLGNMQGLINLDAGSGSINFENNVNLLVGISLTKKQSYIARINSKSGIILHDGTASYEIDKNGFNLQDGFVIISAINDYTMKCIHESVIEAKKGTLLEVGSLRNEAVLIRNLSSIGWHPVTIKFLDKRISIAPGEEAVLHINSFNYLHDDLPRRRMTSKLLYPNKSLSVGLCEFSIVSAFRLDPLLKLLTHEKSYDSLMLRILKDAACLSIVTSNHGPYKQH